MPDGEALGVRMSLNDWRPDWRRQTGHSAHILSAETEIGIRNGQFAQRFLAAEGTPALCDRLGGTRARMRRSRPKTAGKTVRLRGASLRAL